MKKYDTDKRLSATCNGELFWLKLESPETNDDNDLDKITTQTPSMIRLF